MYLGPSKGSSLTFLTTAAFWGFCSLPKTHTFPTRAEDARVGASRAAFADGSGRQRCLCLAPGGGTEQDCLSGRRAGRTE